MSSRTTLNAASSLGSRRRVRKAGKKARSLDHLSDDTLLHLFTFLRVEDILALRHTAQRFVGVTRARIVWLNAFRQHVLEPGLPVPGPKKDFESISTTELETRTILATRFHQNWSSSRPRMTGLFSFNAGNRVGSCLKDSCTCFHSERVDGVAILPGYSGEYVLCLIGKQSLLCWELPAVPASNAPNLVAIWSLDGFTIETFICNEDSTSPGTLAAVVVNPAQPNIATVTVLQLDRNQGCFEVLAKKMSDRHQLLPLFFMHKNWVLMGSVQAWNWHDPNHIRVLVGWSNPRGVNDILCIRYINGYLLIVSRIGIALAPAPFKLGGDWIKNNNVNQKPLPTSHLPIRSIGMCEAAVFVPGQCEGKTETDWPKEPITVSLLVRRSRRKFVLHHFDLGPFDVAARPGTSHLEYVPTLAFRGWSHVRSLESDGAHLAWGSRGTGKSILVTTEDVRTTGGNYFLQHFAAASVGTSKNLVPNNINARFPHDMPMVGISIRQASHVPAPSVNGLNISEDVFDADNCICMAFDDAIGRVAIGYSDGRLSILDFA